jgi:Leucine-rich repeat (LRR) protein
MEEAGISTADRPEFMAVLGLLPPYTAEDVRMAYRERAKQLHPDHGGSVEEFKSLQEAYDRALEYTKFHTGRRQWLADQVERYIHQQDLIVEVRQWGGEVEIEEINWLKNSIGDDFATLADRLRGIRLQNLHDAGSFFHQLAAHRPALEFLLRLDLAGGPITDECLTRMPGLPLLERLDLSGTQVTDAGLARAIKALPNLRWLNVADTQLGWWRRWRLGRKFPKIRIVASRE